MSVLNAILACPRCNAPLSDLRCGACQIDYPFIDDVPWLFADPEAARTDWRNRWQLALRELEASAQAAGLALEKSQHPATTRRLTTLQQGYQHQIEALEPLLKSLSLGKPADLTTYLALKTRLPPQAGLFSYEANVFRDWCWGDNENQTSLDACVNAIGDHAPRRLLVLGSGAGRLAYDLHESLRPELTVALDMNPYLASVTRQLSSGATVDLVEFPRAPIDGASVAVRRSLRAPRASASGFHVVLADALRPPFQHGAFDLVVTPWLIDVVELTPAEFIARLNPLLASGGMWLNHGSLAFAHPDPADCPDIEELRLLSEAHGFTQFNSCEERAPYLASPVSRHARQESIVTLSAIKHQEAGGLPKYQALPDWLAKGRQPVPLLPAFQTQAMTTRIHAFIMTLVDGKRTLKDIALVLEEQQLMTQADAEVAIRGFLIKMFEEALQRGH